MVLETDLNAGGRLDNESEDVLTYYFNIRRSTRLNASLPLGRFGFANVGLVTEAIRTLKNR